MMTLSQYEISRQDRIKQNLERMQNLGLHDLSSKIHSISSPSRRASTGELKRKYIRSSPPSTPDASRRRSSRLQNATPVSYSGEVQEKQKQKRSRLSRSVIRYHNVGPREEKYTAEDEKLLGNTTKSWVLFVDGCGKDGRRVYDSIKGKTCHQCRQKTLGMRTHCSTCEMVQGQFCGDCLYMRYGEHVVEALENPNWVCPVCRGICNCSLCRQARGWPPTGSMYRQVVALGYKSVAHYLVQTRRKAEQIEECPLTDESALQFPSEAKEAVEPVGDVKVPSISRRILKGGRKSVDNSVKSTDANESVLRIGLMETPEEVVSKKEVKCIDNIEKSTEVKAELDSIGARLRRRRLALT